MKTVYVVYQIMNGAILGDTFKIEGKVNHLSVEKAVRDHFDYYRRTEFDKILSWQEEDAFTFDEEQEFWKNY